jgi:hypothetical protein
MASATKRLVAAGVCAPVATTLVSSPGLPRTVAADAPPTPAAAVPGQIRVNQHGYLPHETELVTTMTRRAERHGTVVATDPTGHLPRGGTR